MIFQQTCEYTYTRYLYVLQISEFGSIKLYIFSVLIYVYLLFNSFLLLVADHCHCTPMTLTTYKATGIIEYHFGLFFLNSIFTLWVPQNQPQDSKKFMNC